MQSSDGWRGGGNPAARRLLRARWDTAATGPVAPSLKKEFLANKYLTLKIYKRILIFARVNFFMETLNE